MRALRVVTSGHVTLRWRSHHSIRHSRKHRATRNCHGSMEPELLSIEVLHWGNRDFRPFCSCDLDLDRMTTYDLDPYFLEIYRLCNYELHASRLSKVIVWQTDKQTDATEIIYHAASRVVKNSPVWYSPGTIGRVLELNTPSCRLYGHRYSTSISCKPWLYRNGF